MALTNMKLLIIKKFSIFFLLLSTSLFSTSFAGRRSKFVTNSTAHHHMSDIHNEERTLNKEVRMIEERLLRANTKDYGGYDPSPTLSKPPSKCIPN